MTRLLPRAFVRWHGRAEMASRRRSVTVLAGAVLGLLLVSGCASATAGAEGTWGREAEREPHLVLAEDGSLAGSDGCNRLLGRWSQEGEEIAFSEIASTMMYCDGVDTWLSGAGSATIDGDTLNVFDADGAQIGTLTRD